MAGFASLVANGVALANTLTSTLQDNVQFEAWIGRDEFNQPVYAAAVPIASIIERKQQLVTNYEGDEVVSDHTINILQPIANNGAAERFEPIDPRDRFTLPDGTTGKVASVDTLVNPETSAGYYHIVKLGAR